MSSTPLVIVGVQRSGTTLLRTILEGHPDLLVHPAEPQFFLELYRLHGFSLLSTAAAVEHVMTHPYRAPETEPAWFEKGGPQIDLKMLAHRYLSNWTAAHPERRPVLKHPALVFHLDVVDRLFPGCVILEIVRDPRANVSSQRLRWPHFSVWTCAMRWKRAVRAARQWAAVHPDRTISVSYEALVQQPETMVRQLCEELSLPYLDGLTIFRHEQTIFEPGKGARKKQFTAPDPSHMNLWKQRLSADDVQLIESCCADEMAILGYKRISPPALPLHLKIRRLREATGYRAYMLGSVAKSRLRRLKLSANKVR